MFYLSGTVTPTSERLGLMLTPMMGNKPDLTNTWWAADTGCFSAPEKFRLDDYLVWLAKGPEWTCLFATAPDAVYDWPGTLRVALPALPRIRALGYPAALVVQDGATEGEIPWDEVDCIFTGGTTKWKLSEAAYELMLAAKARGKWAHMGRVNSWRRLRAAAVSGYDSADGTFLKFGPDKNRSRLDRWLSALQHPVLPSETLP